MNSCIHWTEIETRLFISFVHCGGRTIDHQAARAFPQRLAGTCATAWLIMLNDRKDTTEMKCLVSLRASRGILSLAFRIPLKAKFYTCTTIQRRWRRSALPSAWMDRREEAGKFKYTVFYPARDGLRVKLTWWILRDVYDFKSVVVDRFSTLAK